MKKWISTAVISVTAALVLTSCSTATPCGDQANTTPIKIAVLEPFSGPLASYGNMVLGSIKAEADLINAAGGIDGRQIEVISRDNAMDPQKAVQAAQELASDPDVALIEGPSFTFLFNAAKDVFEQSQKVNCQPAVNADGALDGLKYAFRTGPPNTPKVEAGLAYAAANTDIKTIGLVNANDASGQDLDAALKVLAPKYGLTYLGAQFFSPGAKSVVPQVTALKAADSIFVSGTVSDAAITASDARSAGFTGTFIGTDGLFVGTAFVQAGVEAVQGTIFSQEDFLYMTRIPKSDWPKTSLKSFEATVKSQGYLPDNNTGLKLLNGTMIANDCVVQWAAAVKAAGSVDADKVAAAWSTLELSADENPSGTPVKYTKDNHNAYQS
ncbi:MAG: ABC transporter substrate-binding protein, partial [Terrimesophilobacter sp.]